MTMSMSYFASTNTLQISTLGKKVCNFVGGVLSPLLANIALHGLEDAVQKTRGPATIVREGKRVTNNVYCIRYAADFVVFHNTWEGIQRCKEAIQEWLQGMG